MPTTVSKPTADPCGAPPTPDGMHFARNLIACIPNPTSTCQHSCTKTVFAQPDIRYPCVLSASSSPAPERNTKRPAAIICLETP